MISVARFLTAGVAVSIGAHSAAGEITFLMNKRSLYGRH